MDHQTFPFGDFSLTIVVTSPPWYENCYLVKHEPSGDILAIDPGGDAPVILQAIKDLGGTLKEIWLTHGHFDHLGGVADLQDSLKVGCRAHAEERFIVENAAKWASSMMVAPVQPPRSCEYFPGEPQLGFAGAKVRVLHTPGHTPGCVCYDFGPFVLTGDTLFCEGVGRTDLPGGDGKQLQASITRLLGELDDGVAMFSGHGNGWLVSDAKPWWQQMGSYFFG
jgi:hydroxyacylglutathione hydrolase